MPLPRDGGTMLFAGSAKSGPQERAAGNKHPRRCMTAYVCVL
jgi:hypothetical protein